MASPSPMLSPAPGLPENCALEVCMVCAEPITPKEHSYFYRACNHPYHQQCLTMARAQGIEGCPRCAELAEAEAELPKVVKTDTRATELEGQLEEEAEVEASGDSTSGSEYSMGEGGSPGRPCGLS